MQARDDDGNRSPDRLFRNALTAAGVQVDDGRSPSARC
jgi:hypothetical protein